MRTNLERRDCARFYTEAPVVNEECDTGRYYETRTNKYNFGWGIK